MIIVNFTYEGDLSEKHTLVVSTKSSLFRILTMLEQNEDVVSYSVVLSNGTLVDDLRYEFGWGAGGFTKFETNQTNLK